MNKFTTIATAGVALVILIDLVTGQGPPLYNSYMGPPGDYRPPVGIQSYGYAAPDYEQKKDKEYKLSKEDIVKKDENLKLAHKHHDHIAELDDQEYKSTPAPGIVGSLSNTWKSWTGLGRSVRSVNNTEDGPEPQTQLKSVARSASISEDKKSKGRSYDSYEMRHHNTNGYIYFKVPRELVC